MMLTCEKCGRKHPLTDEDVAAFYPRFFCLSCGANLPFPVDEKRLAELLASNDRNRRLTNLKGLEGQETMRHVRPGDGAGEAMGGG